MEIKEKIKEYKKELVLQKAGEFLEKNGFEKAKMADIAAYCGISVGALYKLFPSKDELFYEYVNYQIDTFYKHLTKEFKKLEFAEDRLKYFIKLKFETFMEKKQILKDTAAGDPLFFTKLNVNHKNPAIKVYELLAAQFEKIPNLKTKNYLKTAYLFNAFTYGYIEYWLIYNENLSASIDEAYKLFMKGVVE
jgi:AcrR family transcriptional regulator